MVCGAGSQVKTRRMIITDTVTWTSSTVSQTPKRSDAKNLTNNGIRDRSTSRFWTPGDDLDGYSVPHSLPAGRWMTTVSKCMWASTLEAVKDLEGYADRRTNYASSFEIMPFGVKLTFTVQANFDLSSIANVVGIVGVMSLSDLVMKMLRCTTMNTAGKTQVCQTTIRSQTR